MVRRPFSLYIPGADAHNVSPSPPPTFPSSTSPSTPLQSKSSLSRRPSLPNPFPHTSSMSSILIPPPLHSLASPPLPPTLPPSLPPLSPSLPPPSFPPPPLSPQMFDEYHSAVSWSPNEKRRKEEESLGLKKKEEKREERREERKEEKKRERKEDVKKAKGLEESKNDSFSFTEMSPILSNSTNSGDTNSPASSLNGRDKQRRKNGSKILQPPRPRPTLSLIHI